jgi:preprotein translocase subunit SecA
VQAKNFHAVLEEIYKKIDAVYTERAQYFREQGIDFSEIERMLLLQLLDQSWKQHLYELDQLQKSVGLRAYGQKDPLIEYQKESFGLYQSMMTRVRDLFVDYIFRLKLPPQRKAPVKQQEGPAQQQSAGTSDGGQHKVGRNDLCPCGSGKKYKKCCGA